jgi:hypothetical protein
MFVIIQALIPLLAGKYGEMIPQPKYTVRNVSMSQSIWENYIYITNKILIECIPKENYS